MPANMRNNSAPGQLPISKGAASRGTFSRPRKTPSTGNAGHIKKTNSLKKTNLLRKLHVATVSEEHRQRYLPEPVAAGAGSSGIYKKTNSSKKTRKLRKPLVATVAENVGADNVGTEELGHIKKTNSFKKIKELRKLNPRLAKGTPNHPRGVHPLNHTADTPTCHCKHLPPSPQIPLERVLSHVDAPEPRNHVQTPNTP